MSHFSSILASPETLALLPLALRYTPLNALFLLIGLPLLGVALVSFVVNRGALRKAARDPGGRYSDPTWLGADGETKRVGDNTATGALPGRSEPEDAGGKGGASARW